MEDTTVDTQGLILSENAMGTQLGEPDVEDVTALGLGSKDKKVRTFHLNPFRIKF